MAIAGDWRDEKRKMLTKTTRPPTDDERAILAQRWKASGPAPVWVGCSMTAFALCGSLLGLIIGSLFGVIFPDEPRHYFQSLLIGGVAGLAIGLLYVIMQTARARRPFIASNIEFVEVLHCLPSDIVTINFNDLYLSEAELLAYAMQVEENTILILPFHEVEDQVKVGEFPCREFNITVTALPEHGKVIQIECLGDQLPVSHDIHLYDDTEIPQIFCIMEGTLEMLPEILRKYRS